MPPRRWWPAGFTMLELMVALAIGSVVLLTAHGIAVTLGDTAAALAETAARADGDANAERALRALLGRLEVGTDLAGEFEGDAHTLRFTTWCDVPAGWQERCVVTLAVRTLAGRRALVATPSAGPALVLYDRLYAGGFRYLRSARHGGSWLRQWGRSVTAPEAVAVILEGVERDTLIVRIGERG